MNEISRCCRLLGVQSGASIEEFKKAYRDLVQVWHPDRFSSNERLKEKAQEQLKQINLAYEYLLANAFQDGVLVEPPEEEPLAVESISGSGGDAQTAPDFSAGPEPSVSSRRAGWLAGVLVVVALAATAAAWLVYQKHQKLPPKPVASVDAGGPEKALVADPAANSPAPPPAAVAANRPATYVSQLGTNPPYSQDILGSMINIAAEQQPAGADGLTIVAPPNNWWVQIQADQIVSPPFVMRATIKLTDINDVRLYYGIGRVIFNWANHPSELRVKDPVQAELTGVPGKGLVMNDAWHELAWEVTETGMTVAVDGEVRFHNDNNCAGLKGSPGIGPGQYSMLVKKFILEARHPPAPPPARDHVPPSHDILSALIPEKRLKVTTKPDGLVLFPTEITDSENRLKTAEQVHAPFTISTRAKTDSLNLRLFCGPGEVIFNHEVNAHELFVRDPMSHKEFKVAGKGFISPNEWHYFVWKFEERKMTLQVDGETRFQKDGDYHTLQVRPGIGPAWASRVTVDYFIVDKN